MESDVESDLYDTDEDPEWKPPDSDNNDGR